MLNLKFPYSMNDVHLAAKQNRFTVMSTFSGGGGSSIGYKLVGGNVLVVNECIPLATEVYRANFPDTHIIKDDIRNVTGNDFLELSGLKVGELDVFDGSPPCSSFSKLGQRELGWDKVKTYSNGMKVKNVEDLFYDFIRISNDLQPINRKVSLTVNFLFSNG